MIIGRSDLASITRRAIKRSSVEGSGGAPKEEKEKTNKRRIKKRKKLCTRWFVGSRDGDKKKRTFEATNVMTTTE